MTQLLTILNEFVRNRLGSTLLGLLAICSLVWFAGPLIGLNNPQIRLFLIMSILILYFLIILLRWWWARSRGSNLHKKLQAHEEQLAGRQLEIELLKEQMEEAIASLKSSELGVRYRGNAALYALPWFMIIGPAASGKSTLFRNSGLHFPFSSREDLNVKGFGGTRNCDWWFADEAILLDTAGRYTTEEDDRDEWKTFLQLLKKYRPRLPINGIIVSMSLIDVLTADLDGITWHVKVIRERINELYHLLGYVFPVYLIFTKCDLLKGFEEFFGDLSEVERCQIWGLNLLDTSFDYDMQIKTFATRLQGLYEKLTQLRLHKLSIERNLQRKAIIYDFPEQFLAGSDKIMAFIQLLFKENPYQETPHFCGTYFTSGTQEGLPIQRLLGNLQAAFGYSQKNTVEETKQYENKSYFIKSVFSQVIFTHKNIAAKTRQQLRAQRWLKSASVIVAGLTVITAFALYSTSLTSNAMLLWHGKRITRELAENYNTSPYTSGAALAALLDAGDYYQLLSDYDKQIPWHLRLGLYRGNTQKKPLEQMLLLAMRPSFLQPIDGAIAQQLQNYSQQWSNANSDQQREQLRGLYYTLLRAYLMLSFPARITVAQATPTLSLAWSQALSSGTVTDAYQQQQELQRYGILVNFYLTMLQQSDNQSYTDEISPLPLHVRSDLVNVARQQLYTPTNANNLYAQLRSTGEATLPAITIQQLLTGEGANLLVSNENLAAIYTVNGWHDYMQAAIVAMVKSASEGDWVMDTPLTNLNEINLEKANDVIDAAAEKRLTAELRQLYFNDYSQAWFSFLSSIQVTPFASLEDATTEFNILSSANGPMTQLIKAFVENMNVKDSYTQYVPELKPAFVSIRKVVSPGINNKVSDSMKSYLQELTLVQADLQRLSASSNQDRDAQQYASKLLSGAGNDLELNKSTLTISMMTDPIDNGTAKAALKSVLLQPVREAWRTILVAATQGVEQQWQTEVYTNYQQNISGRFPFNKSASDDVSFNDLNDFFQPKNGLLWNFVNTYLAPYLYVDSNGWHEQQWLNVGAGFSPEFLQSLSQAKLLSDGLFKGGNDQPGFSFQVYPEPTPGLSQIILIANGQSYRYQNGPQQWQEMNWPGNTSMNQASELTAIAASGLSPNTLEAQGSWGLMHLLAQSQLTPSQDGTYRATWTMKSDEREYQVTLLFQGDSQDNVFQQLLINQFSLPASLFGQRT